MKKLVEVQVILSVRQPGMWMSQKTPDGHLRRTAEELASEVKRHCDYYEGHSFENIYECEHCGHQWEDWDSYPNDPDCPSGMPRCCSKAAKEWEDAQAIRSLGNREEGK